MVVPKGVGTFFTQSFHRKLTTWVSGGGGVGCPDPRYTHSTVDPLAEAPKTLGQAKRARNFDDFCLPEFHFPQGKMVLH